MHFILVDITEVVYTINATAIALASVFSKPTTSYSKHIELFHVLQKQLHPINYKDIANPPHPTIYFSNYVATLIICLRVGAMSYASKG